jgi:hypothetical protein|tara:strand:+ start:1115 stop:1411 length:297 start_codon:yes stop_codon:yes gene_type:complete
MNRTRYKYEDLPLTPEEGEKVKIEKTEDARSEVARRKRQVVEAETYLDICLLASPPTHTRVQIELNPGDEGYDECSDQFNPGEYQGNYKWENKSSTQQ